VLVDELSRQKKAKRVLEKKVETLTEANAELAFELRESMPSAIFSNQISIIFIFNNFIQYFKLGLTVKSAWKPLCMCVCTSATG
jgi:hypothetical protein